VLARRSGEPPPEHDWGRLPRAYHPNQAATVAIARQAKNIISIEPGSLSAKIPPRQAYAEPHPTSIAPM